MQGRKILLSNQNKTNKTDFKAPINTKGNKLNILMLGYDHYNYVINGHSNTGTLNDGTTTSTFTLTQGNYSISDFVSHFNTVVNTLGHALTYTLSYSTTTGKLTISSTANFTLSFGNSEYLDKLMGFDKNNTGSASYIAPYIANLNYLNRMNYIEVDNMEFDNYIKPVNINNSNNNILCSINMSNYSFGEYVDFNMNNNYNIQYINEENRHDINSVNIRLLDAEMNIINDNGQNITLMLEIK